MKQLIMVLTIFTVLSAFAFASGSSEKMEITGTVTEITSNADGMMDITISTAEGESYVVAMKNEAVMQLNLQAGSPISVEGEMEDKNGGNALVFEKATSGDMEYEPEGHDSDMDNQMSREKDDDKDDDDNKSMSDDKDDDHDKSKSDDDKEDDKDDDD